MTERTPAQFRAIYNQWSKQHEAITDSKIIPPNPKLAVSPRHADLSDELRGLLYWRQINRDVQSLTTNWMIPDNENNVEEDDDEPRSTKRSTECEYVIRPSESEMMAALQHVEYDCRYRQSQGAEMPEECWPIPKRNRPIGPEVELGNEYKSRHPLKGNVRPIARLGGIRFSTNDSEGVGPEISPTRGSVIGWHAESNARGYFPIDSFGKPKGSGEDQEDIDSSNQFFAELLSAQPHRYIEKGHYRAAMGGAIPILPPITMPLNEARAFCGLAPLVPSNDNRPALPCGSRKASDSFLGHKVSSNVADVLGSDSPEENVIRVQERSDLRAKLSAIDAKVLDTAVHASNYEDIGKAFDFAGKTAQRQGKRLLLAANCNLLALIDRAAA